MSTMMVGLIADASTKHSVTVARLFEAIPLIRRRGPYDRLANSRKYCSAKHNRRRGSNGSAS